MVGGLTSTCVSEDSSVGCLDENGYQMDVVYFLNKKKLTGHSLFKIYIYMYFEKDSL